MFCGNSFGMDNIRVPVDSFCAVCDICVPIRGESPTMDKVSTYQNGKFTN